MCLSPLETKRQHDELLLLWQRDLRRLGDVTLECRDARGQVSHSLVLAQAACPSGQQVVQAVLREHPDRDERGHSGGWQRDRDSPYSLSPGGSRTQPTTSALLSSSLCSQRIVRAPRRGLAA